MTRTHLPPEQWAEAAAAWGPEFFAIRVTQCTDVARLRAAAKYEAERDNTRPERIARINKRLTTIQQ